MIDAIHDRMPVILPPDAYDRWLSAVQPDPRDLLVPYPSGLMTMWPVSPRVNKANFDHASVLTRASRRPPSRHWTRACKRGYAFSHRIPRRIAAV